MEKRHETQAPGNPLDLTRLAVFSEECDYNVPQLGPIDEALK
jgi:hypothetical protein